MTCANVRGVLAVCASLALLAACEDENNEPTPNQSGELTIDASSNTDYKYFSFSADTLVAVTDPLTSNNWDLAFRRFEVRLNGGLGGPKGNTGFNLANNAGASEAEIVAMTAESEKAAFDAVDEDDVPAAGQFTTEALAEDLTGWFGQTPTGLVANPGRAWKVRLAGDRGHALIRVERIDNAASPSPTDGMAGIKVGYRLQATGGALGALDSVVVALDPGSSATINLSTEAVVPGAAATDCSWDLRVTRAYELQVNTNATCSTGTFPLSVNEDFATLTTAADAPEYGPFISLISGPIPNSFSDPRGPFLYGVDPANPTRLYPTFNTYLVKVGDAVYKLQLTGYYSATGASGNPTIRYARIQ